MIISEFWLAKRLHKMDMMWTFACMIIRNQDIITYNVISHSSSPLLLMMMSLAGSSPNERSTTSVVNTGTTGTTVWMDVNILRLFVFDINKLTPANQRDDDKILGCDTNEHNDYFPEHEQCLRSHPHHSNQRKVVHKDRDGHTATVYDISGTWTESYEHQGHYHQKEKGNGELNVMLSTIFPT